MIMSDVLSAGGNAAKGAGTDWLGWSQMIGTGLQGIGSIMGANAAKKNYKLNADAFNFNKEMQSATTLANIQNRIKQYQAVNPNADVSNLQSLAQRLQSYLPNQSNMVNQAQPMANTNTQAPTMQTTNQAPPQQSGFNSLSQYGRRG